MAITDQFIKAPSGLIIMEPEACIIETISDSPNPGETTMYIGYSGPLGGRITTSAGLTSCTIKRLHTVAATGLQTIMWATGNTRYDKTWSSRASYTYAFLSK